MEFTDLLSIIAKDDRRAEFAALGERLHELGSSGEARTAATEDERREVLDELRQQLRLHLRAARHPVPSDDELQEMIERYFDSG